MPRVLVTKQQLDEEIADWLRGNPDHELAEDVERAQMALASPGQWEVARVTEDPNPDPVTPD